MSSSDEFLIETEVTISPIRRKIEQIIDTKDSSIEAISFLVENLLNTDLGVKDICIIAITNLPIEASEPAAKLIAPMLANPNIEIRNNAAEILTKLAIPAALYDFLKNEDADVRKFTSDVIGLIANSSSLDYIYPLLNDTDDNVVASAIETIGNIGDRQSISILIDFYHKNENVKANTIESIGKIGGIEAQNFILNILQDDKDSFIQLACIDALSFCGEDINICYKLLDELVKTNSEIQPILLKTIIAISFRIGKEITLNSNLRYIAYTSMIDEDIDIRIAGLLSLGQVYIESDIDSLLIEMTRANPETKNIIFNNLLLNSDIKIIKSFFLNISNLDSNNSIEIELINSLPLIWNKIEESKKNEIFAILLNKLFSIFKNNDSIIIELLLNLDKPRVLSITHQIIKDEPNSTIISTILDIIEINHILDLAELVEMLAQHDNETGQRAKDILSTLK